MTKAKKAIVGFLAVLMLVSVTMIQFPTAVWAAETHANGVHIALESDRDSYQPGDIATFTLSTTNQGEQAIGSANYALSLPENMALRDPSSIKGNLGGLAPSETKTIQVSATVLDNVQTRLARTGDEGSGLAMLLLVAALVMILAFMMRDRKPTPVTFRKVTRRSNRMIVPEKPKHAKNSAVKVSRITLSVFVIFGLLGAAVPMAGVLQAHADEPSQPVCVSHVVCIAESEQEVIASLSISQAEVESDQAHGAADSLMNSSYSAGASDDIVHADSTDPSTSHDGDDLGVTYQEGVKEVKDYEVEDGLFLVDTNRYPLKKGDKVAFLPTEDFPQGAAGTLTSVIAKDGATDAASLEQARSFSDIFERISVRETGVRADFDGLELADGVELQEEVHAYVAAKQEDEIGSLKVKVPLSETVDAVIKFTPSIELSAEWTLWEGFRQFDVGFSNEMSISIEGELFELKKSIPLLEKPLPIITDGLSCVGVMPALEVKLDGTLAVNFELVNSVDIVFENGDFRTKTSTTSDLDAELETKGSMGIAPYVNATFLGIELVDFELDAGVEGTAAMTDRPTGMRCVDMKANVFMNLSCGKNTEWMKTLHSTFSRKLITADNCPKMCKWVLHYEDGKRVEKCTYEVDGDSESNDTLAGGGSGGGGGSVWGEESDDNESDGSFPRPQWTYDADSTRYTLDEEFDIDAGTKLTVSGDEWFNLDYVTASDPETGLATGTLFKMTWKSLGGDNSYSGSQYYGNTIGGDSPVRGGELTIEVLYGHITIFRMPCIRELPSLKWSTCKTIECPLYISDSNIQIEVDGTHQLKCWQNVSDYQEDITDVNDLPSWGNVWSSRDTDIAWVDDAGLVHGIAPGTTTITCNYYGFQRSCLVTVK